MTRLRKSRLFNYILPLGVAGLLFSIVFSVFGAQYSNKYIGMLKCDLYTNTSEEMMTLYLHSNRDLTDPPVTVHIYTGGSYGLPVGLAAAANLAMIGRTLVDVTTEYLNVTGDYNRVTAISQIEDPDNIAGYFGTETMDGIYGTVNELYQSSLSQRNYLNDITTQEGSMNTTLGDMGFTLESQGPALTQINTTGDFMISQLNDTYNGLLNQTAVLGDVSIGIGTLDTAVESVNAQAVTMESETNDLNADLVSETDAIDSQLATQGTMLTNILDQVN